MIGNERVCAVPLRRRDGRLEILIFDHPLAGPQLVKGHRERRERPEAGAARELWEEAGANCGRGRAIGRWRLPGLDWHITVFDGGRLSDSWEHDCADDGGHRFRFRWVPLDEGLENAQHPEFGRAVAWIRATLAHGVPFKI